MSLPFFLFWFNRARLNDIDIKVALLRWSSSVVEHVLGKDGVTGSIPVSSSTYGLGDRENG